MTPRSPASQVAACLAASSLAGEWSPEAIADRARIALGRNWRWMPPLATEMVLAYRRPPSDRPRELAAWIGSNAIFERVWQRPSARVFPEIRQWTPFEPAMAGGRWPVPAIASIGQLSLHLGVDAGQLAWFADRRSWERSVADEALRHYRYRWSRKPSGGARLLEAPKFRLREIQRLILHRILDRVPAHPCAHGFVPGRSVVTFVEPHVGARVVLSLDLEDFFGSVPASRVFGMFRTAGYPEPVAHCLTALATNVVPRSVWREAPRPAEGSEAIDRHRRLGRRLATPHLPQGAPCSPAIGNLCAHGLDRRLHGVAGRFGMVYTRYADDLAFSGPVSASTISRITPLLAEIARGEGFALNQAKTRTASQAQRQRLAGVVVNRHPNLARQEYDELRAILHNCAVGGLAAQNRGQRPDFAEYLGGRVSWAIQLNPGREAKLRRLLALAMATTTTTTEHERSPGRSAGAEC